MQVYNKALDKWLSITQHAWDQWKARRRSLEDHIADAIPFGYQYGDQVMLVAYGLAFPVGNASSSSPEVRTVLTEHQAKHNISFFLPPDAPVENPPEPAVSDEELELRELNRLYTLCQQHPAHMTDDALHNLVRDIQKGVHWLKKSWKGSQVIAKQEEIDKEKSNRKKAHKSAVVEAVPGVVVPASMISEVRKLKLKAMKIAITKTVEKETAEEILKLADMLATTFIKGLEYEANKKAEAQPLSQ